MKVNVEYDTVDKSLQVKLDGQILEDVSSVSFSAKTEYDGTLDYDDFSCYICQRTKEEEDDVVILQHLTANEKGEIVPGKNHGFKCKVN